MFDYLNTRAKSATDKQQNLYHEAEQRFHRKYSPGEMITSAASYNLSTLYYHENVKNDILVLTVDPPNPDILRQWKKLSEPLQIYIMLLFEAIDVCVGIFVQQDPEVAYMNYAAMIDDKMIDVPVKHPTEVAKLVLNREIEEPGYFWYGNIKNWKLHFVGDSPFTSGSWVKAKKAVNAETSGSVQKKPTKVVKQ